MTIIEMSNGDGGMSKGDKPIPDTTWSGPGHCLKPSEWV